MIIELRTPLLALIADETRWDDVFVHPTRSEIRTVPVVWVWTPSPNQSSQKCTCLDLFSVSTSLVGGVGHAHLQQHLQVGVRRQGRGDEEVVGD